MKASNSRKKCVSYDMIGRAKRYATAVNQYVYITKSGLYVRSEILGIPYVDPDSGK